MKIEAIQQMLDENIPMTSFLQVKVEEMSPGAVRLRMPFAPQALNHLGTIYAGAIFSLAEIAGGVAMVSAFDPTQFFMVVRRLEIEYLRPAQSDLVCAPRLSPEVIAQVRANIAEQGKSDLPLPVEVIDAEGQVVARLQATYYLRSQRPDTADDG